MGYTTTFKGEFDFNKEIDFETHKLLYGLANTRRMARNIKGYGVDGEFYCDENEFDFGKPPNKTIIDYNEPPKTQPSLWLCWVPTNDRLHLVWNGAEKFYHYVEWLNYLIKNIIKKRGYILNGVVSYQGEDKEDFGVIDVVDNKVNKKCGVKYNEYIMYKKAIVLAKKLQE